MHPTGTELGINIPYQHAGLYPAPGNVPVFPVISLAVVPHRNFSVGNDSTALETMENVALSCIRLLDQVAVLHWRSMSDAGPTRSRKVALRVGYRLPPEPV